MFKRKKKAEGEDEDDGKGGVVDQLEADAVEGVGKKAWRGAKNFVGKRGWKGMAKLGGKALGVAGAAYGAYSAYDNIKQGNYGEAAVDGGLALGSAALSAGGIGALGTTIAGGATAAGGALAAGAGMLGTAAAGIGTVIASPVVLGALAVAALGAGAYYGYKYLTRKKLDLLSRVRYAQYGFFPTDKDHVQAVFGLEDKLKDYVIYGKGGATLDGKRVKPEELFSDFDVDAKDKDSIGNWLAWFNNRFKPVFLTHVSALKGIAADKWLSDVDGLEPDVALKYLAAVKFPEGPYGMSTSPFKDLKSLDAGRGDVDKLIQIAQTELEKKAKEKGSSSKGATVAGEGAGAMPVANPVSALNETASSSTAASSGVSDKVLTTAAAGAMATMPEYKGGTTSAVGSSVILEALGGDNVDGLDVIRFKAYGLVKMELEKVRGLRALEKAVGGQLLFSKGVATWSGSLEQILATNGSVFGVDASNDDMAANWLNWFQQRFLPVYLNYATAVNAQTGKPTPAEGKSLLKANQIVDIATALYTTTGKSGSVWNVGVSPWIGYELNSDVRSVDGNMQGLKEAAKNTVLNEPGGKAANQATAEKSATNTTTAAAGAAAAPGFFGKLWQGTKNVFSSGGATPTAPGGPAVGGSAGTAGGLPSTVSGGQAVDKMGTGSGGMIDSIPKPTGNKSWAAMKDTIMAAAKAAGVDGKLLATIAAIESGFDSTVKAGTSSATGLFQFIGDTWNWMLKKYGAKYGIAPGTPPTDARANALMGAEYIKDNVSTLDGKIGRPLTDTDIYFAHFLGSGGAKKFLTADPNAIAATLMPKEAASNRGIFYDKQGTPLTVGQVYQLVNGRVRGKAKQYGIGADGGEAVVDSAAAKTTPPTGPAPAAAGGSAAPAIAGDPKADGKDKPSTPTTAAPVQQQKSAFGLGASASGVTATAATSTSAGSSTSVTAPITAPSPLASFTGPQPLQQRVNAAKTQASEVTVTNLTDTNTILTDSKNILIEIRDAIKGGLTEAVKSIGGVPAAPSKDATSGSQAARVQPRKPSEQAPMPVSVARPPAPY
jgi:hypothetical protein